MSITCDSNLPDHKYVNTKRASYFLCYVKQASFAWQYFSDTQKPRWKYRFLKVLHHDFFERLTVTLEFKTAVSDRISLS